MITVTPKLAGLVAASAVALMAPAALAANPHKKVKAAPKTQKAPAKSVKAAAWSFPRCTGAQAEYEYIYSGDPCTSTAPAATTPTIVPAPAIESGVASRSPASRMNPVFCNGQAEYDYVYAGCEG